MYGQISSIVIDPDPAQLREMTMFLNSRGINVTAQLQDLDLLTPFISQGEAPQLVVLNVGEKAQEAMSKLGTMIARAPATAFFMVSNVVTPDIIMNAMRAGLKEFFATPLNEEKLAAGIDR